MLIIQHMVDRICFFDWISTSRNNRYTKDRKAVYQHMNEHPDIILIAVSTYSNFKAPENFEKLQAVPLLNTEQICCVPKNKAAYFLYAYPVAIPPFSRWHAIYTFKSS